jgi:hypothetical protein
VDSRIYFRDQRKPGERREPLRTLQEMADEFGVHRNVLIGAMRRDPNHPQPQLRSGGHGGPVCAQRAWYSPTEMRTWWAVYGLPDHAAADTAA